jgi:hypothetical protein
LLVIRRRRWTSNQNLLVTARAEILAFDYQVAMIGRYCGAFFGSCFLLAVCETETMQISQAEESPGNPAYQRVAANLDTGGLIYLYWSAEKAFGELDKKLESVRDMTVSSPGLTEDEKNSLRDRFDLGIRLILNSGLQGVKLRIKFARNRAGSFSRQDVHLSSRSLRLFVEHICESAA